MKKFISYPLLLMLLVACLVLTGCQDKTTLTKFEVTETANAEIGIPFVLEDVAAIDSNGKIIPAEITVKDSTGAEVEVKNGSFTPTSIDPYTVTFTVRYGNKNKLTQFKDMTVSIYDLTDPVIAYPEALKHDIFAPDGGSFDLSMFQATDNSGEAIEPNFAVTYNGEELTVSGNTFELTEKGVYQVTVTAEDASGNCAEEVFSIHATDVLDAEAGVAFQNRWYASEISQDFARTGNSSYKIGIFGNNANWFRDVVLFGECATESTETYQYLSYWVYFDFAGAGFDGAVFYKGSGDANTHKYQIYDEYGTELLPRWDGLTLLVEGTEGAWVRMIVDMRTKYDPDGNAIENSGFQDLGAYDVWFGVWSNDAGGEATIETPVYFDDIMLLKDDAALAASLATGWSESKPNDPIQDPVEPDPGEDPIVPDKTEAIPLTDFETDDSYNPNAGDASVIEISRDFAHSGKSALKFVGHPTLGWINIRTFLNDGTGETANRIRFWVYIPTPDGASDTDFARLKAYSEASGTRLKILSVATESADKTMTQGTVFGYDPAKAPDGSNAGYLELKYNAWHCIEVDLFDYPASQFRFDVLEWQGVGSNAKLTVYVDDVAYVKAVE